MTLANAKPLFTRSTLTKSLLAAAAAGALLFSSPAKSGAQVVIGARIGRPAVVVAAYPNRYEIERREAIARRNAEIRHEEWLRAHRYDRYRHDRDHDYR